jgi:hypothetical protein
MPKPDIDTVMPTKATLKKYGMDEVDFIYLLEYQDYKCPICKKTPNPSKDGKVRFVVDHYHAKGWKKMPPEERKRYVRGLLCWYDNRYFLSKGITPEKARSMVEYLMRFEDALK